MIEELTENEDQFAKYMDEESIRLYDKGDYSKVEITDNEVNEEQKNYAIETTQNGLDTYSDRFKCAKYVKEQFENKYGGNWCVIITIHEYGDSNFSNFDKCYTCFIIGEYCVENAKVGRGDDKGDYNKIEIF